VNEQSAPSASESADQARLGRWSRLRNALDQARRDLLDPTRRNRLLHAPLTGKRPWCMSILGANADDVFWNLYREDNFGGYLFAPDDENTDSPASDSPIQLVTEPRRKTSKRRPLLQTSLPVDKLEKRLTKIFRENRTIEEEQGLSTLFLAVGFLKWFDSAQSEEASFAPLILVPVTLSRLANENTYSLKGRDDELVANVSLSEKLQQFNVQLPDLPEGDEWRPTEYFEQVRSSIARQPRFRLDEAAIGLGFFSFSKFMMWRDLDAQVWDGHSILENSLLNALLGESEFDERAPIISDDEPVDSKIDLSTAVHVVDADSSQAIVVEEIKEGRNLVVQGPPGTGKSQTITNIIAAAVHSGRSVLFVAEKAAALTVVHDRLKHAGLGPLCLEMHSRKANKRDVLKSLDEALRFSAAGNYDGSLSKRVAVARDQLNNWKSIVHKPVGSSGLSAFEIIGTQLNLKAANIALLPERLPFLRDWSSEQIEEARTRLGNVTAAILKLGCQPAQHNWRYTAVNILSPFDVERLLATIGLACDALSELEALGTKIFEHVAGVQTVSLRSSTNVVKTLRHLASAPPNRSLLKADVWRTKFQELAAALQKAQHAASDYSFISSTFHAEAWNVDPDPLLFILRKDGPSFFRRLGSKYRSTIASMRAICKEAPPKSLDAKISVLERLRHAQSARKEFEAVSDLLKSAIEPSWRGIETDWADIDLLRAWAGAALTNSNGDRLLDLAGKASSFDLFHAFAEKLAPQIERVDALIADVFDVVKPNVEALWEAPDHADVSVSKLKTALDGWREGIDSCNDWVSCREALASLRDYDLGPVADRLRDGRIAPNEARKVFDLALTEALWDRASKDVKELASLDGAVRDEVVAEFRRLDRLRIQAAQKEVISEYLAKRPSGHIGEMSVIRTQIERRRGHLPVRKLMIEAGGAIRRLKPVFLMSPLSVAQFLSPKLPPFDLLVFDEASQVAPEDALGAVARARKFVVVGDDKQLPPTNFFKSINAGDDAPDDESEEGAALISRPSDFESILTLSRSRGMPERLLEWHYRSKHPSLIALSNDECYGGRLLLPPSPVSLTQEVGLSLVRTPRGHYDRGGTSRDLIQAELLVQALSEQISRYPDKSIGVACLSAQQRDAVDDMIDKAGLRGLVESFEPKADERLFVKNLEAVQGDERDVIFISIGYGVAPEQSKPFLNFGPVSRDGGERRLNVLASRAREKCVVFSSITAADIPADAAVRGTRMLRALLHAAETGHVEAGRFTGGDFDSPFEEAVARVIREAGYTVHSQVGVSGFRIDLGVIDPAKPGEYILGVECDGATYHSARSARDRDRIRHEVLESKGWRLYRIWSTDWFRHTRREADKLIAAIKAEAGKRGSNARPIKREGERPPPTKPSLSVPLIQQAAVVKSTETDYRECSLHVPRKELLELTSDELAALAGKVVDAEGPIHTAEVARRIREAFRLQRTGQRILEAVETSLKLLKRRGLIEEERDFWSVKGRPVSALRSRRTASAALRKPEMIAPAEYRFAIIEILKDAVSATSEEVTVEAARSFGFDRTGADLRDQIRAQIALLLKSRQLLEEGHRLRVAP